jgi:hypothetical protein
MDLDFEISEKEDLHEIIKQLAKSRRNLKCNRNLEMKKTIRNGNIVKFDFPRSFDFLICINSIENLEYVSDINLEIFWFYNFYSKSKVDFRKEIFLPTFMLSQGVITLNVTYLNEIHASEAQNFFLNCDIGYVDLNVRTDYEKARIYLNDFANIVKKEISTT